jgi:sec-independent protein translocase protein TatC
MSKTATGEMPFLDHLEELRWRIVWSLGAIVVGLFLGFFLVLKVNLIRVLQAPIIPYLPERAGEAGKLVVTNPVHTFSVTLQFAIIIGLILASPVIIYQLWAFLSPALHRHEKKVVIPVIVGAVGLFVLGVSMAWFFVLPMILKFLMTFQADTFDTMITASEYFSMVTTLALTFGGAFELPILVLALAALGLVTPVMLAKFRPYAFVLAFLASAVITPGDIFLASLAMAVPLYFLYEVSIILAKIVFRKRQARNASYDDSAAGSLA